MYKLILIDEAHNTLHAGSLIGMFNDEMSAKKVIPLKFKPKIKGGVRLPHFLLYFRDELIALYELNQ